MSVFQHGVPINIVERVYLIDPLTEIVTPTNATTAIFTVEAPDGTETTYEYGLAPNVTNPATGVYVLFLDPPADPGHYSYEFDSDDPDAHSEGAFDVLQEGIAPAPATLQTPGPCTSWISGDEVAEACSESGVGSSTFLLDDVAAAASAILYELSGHLFPGVCQRTVRPCQDTCSCFSVPVGVAGDGLGLWTWGGYGWGNECGDRCGCGTLSYVKLTKASNIRRILEVKIDGAVVPPDEYRLDRRRDLVRLDDPGPPVVRRVWPGCQNITLADDQEGTFAITYEYGADPPSLARDAAAELACELYKARNGGRCKLPSRVTKVVRQGVTWEKMVPVAELLRKGASGLTFVDSFLAAYNPAGLTRKPAVWSPDTKKLPRKVG